MNLSTLPFLAGSVAEAHAGTHTCVLVALLLWTGEYRRCKRRMTRFTIQGQFFTKKKMPLLPNCFRLLNIRRLPPSSA